jgi:hypothetical protein
MDIFWFVILVLLFYCSFSKWLLFSIISCLNYTCAFLVIPLLVSHFRSFLNGGSTVQCFIWLNSNHLCCASGTIAAVIKVHHIYDVSCCWAIDQKRIHGSFLWTDVRTLIKFHVLLGTSTLECYRSLKEGLGTCASSCETFHWWANAIKIGQEERDAASPTGFPTLVKMNATWNKWNLSLNVRAVFRARQLVQKLESLQQVLTISPSTSWGNKKFVHSGFRMCLMMTKESCVFLPPPIFSIREMMAVHLLIAF